MLLDVEVRRDPEVALPARREADVSADTRDLERPGRPAIQVVTDDVPVALVETQRIRVHRPLARPGAAGAPVSEADRALLRDRGLELRETTGELRRVVRHADAHALGGVRGGLGEAGAPEGEVLQREAKRLRVGELALEVVERRLERCELVVVEVEPLEEVVLGAQRVELLSGELVALRLERNAERGQLRTVGVEAARERLVRHLAVALDVRLDVTGRQEAPLGHEEGDERELPDQLVGVVRHPAASLQSSALAVPGATRATRARLRGDGGCLLEVLVRRAVVATRERRALARLALPRRRVAARDAAVEEAGFDLLLDERRRGADALAYRPGDLGLRRDREVAPDVGEQRAIRAGEVVGILGEPCHRALALDQHRATVTRAARRATRTGR